MGWTPPTERYANKSSPEYIMQEQIQKQATMWTLYLTATSQFIAMFVATILGAYSDKAGRKIPLMLPPVGAALNGLNYLIVIYLHLPLWTLFVGAALQGLGGEHTTEIATCCSYIADITTKHQRTFRMVVLEVVFSFAFGGAQLCAGYAIHIYGYQAAFGYTFPFHPLHFSTSVFFVRESLKVEDTSVFIGGKLIARCLSDFGMIYVSSISYTSSLLLSAFAFNDIMMFMVPVVAALSSLTIPVIRSRLSRIVEPTEQGVLFACLGCIESVANFVSPVTFNAIYAATLELFSGFVFTVLAAIAVINMMLTGAVNTGGARKESLQETYMLLYYDVQLCEDGSILCNGECVHANNVCKARCNCIPPQLRSRLRTRPHHPRSRSNQERVHFTKGGNIYVENVAPDGVLR
uniref:Proton-coupled folate transporter n=1 Tax=Saccoglossus kowalevskii TaxID=10224 RepID=A0ABM0MHC6_SACKO|nr:PREDICTED: proton-coupled folate transporter-like [Saccoglossus kowalevskii]